MSTLAILAAGLGTRYKGKALKQLETFGPNKETLIDYAIYDAIRTGFKNFIFIIREETKDLFRKQILSRLPKKYNYSFVFQKDQGISEKVLKTRRKPWGTAHAVLACKDLIKSPFSLINADDFYGYNAFLKAAMFLRKKENKYSIISFILHQTISKFGSVNRGILEISAHKNELLFVKEYKKIQEENHKIFDETGTELDHQSHTSMNFWCLNQEIIKFIEVKFKRFIHKHHLDRETEFFLPNVINELIEEKKISVQVIPSNSLWFGVSYKKEAPLVRKNIRQLIKKNLYPSSLWD